MAATPSILETEISSSSYDGVAFEIYTVEMPENSSAIINLQGLAKRTTGVTKSWNQSFVYKRGTGNASIVGTLANLFSPIGDLGAITWTLEPDTDGGNVLIMIKGQTDATIFWYFKLRILTIQE